MSTPHGDHGHKGENPLVQMMVSMSGAAAPEHETEPPGVAPVSVQAGHEPDAFDVRGILYVPALVAVTLVLAYVLVTVVFRAIVTGKPTENQHSDQQVVAEFGTTTHNQKAARINTTDPKPISPEKPDTAVAQPRLEGVRTQAEGPNDPPFYRSKRSMQEGNPPEIRPEDLRADNYVDPATGQKVLAEYTTYKVNGQPDKARVPIDEAIHMLAHGELKGLPVKKDAKPLPTTSDEVPKQSNSGRGTPAAAPKAEVKDHKDHKH